MIQSMTGFGKASAEISNKRVTVEVKSINSKQLDLQTKVGNLYREREMTFRAMVQRELQRGKIDLTVTAEVIATSASDPHIHADIVRRYYEELTALQRSLGLADASQDPMASALFFQVLLKMPDAVSQEQPTVDEEELAAVEQLVAEAIARLVEFRQQEGASLARIFTEKIANIQNYLAQVVPFEQERTARIRQNLLEKLNSLPVDYDRNRLEQEMIFYIEKLDINEERHRLENHLRYFLETMNAPMDAGGHGKKLGFIAQEMGREINTLGSKSNNADMQHLVVKMKDELEQIKEQVLNVL